MTAPGYVISTTRDDGRGNVIYECVADNLQRFHVTIPRKLTDAATVASVIDTALAGLYRKPKPTH